MTGNQSIFHVWGHEQVPYMNWLPTSTDFLLLYYDYPFPLDTLRQENAPPSQISKLKFWQSGHIMIIIKLFAIRDSIRVISPTKRRAIRIQVG